MNCYRTSNNKFFTAPPRMADARHFTDYKESTKRNLMLQSEVESDNSYEYRMYLINNAEKLMDINNKKAFLINGVTECKQPYEQGTMLPEQSTQVCNTRTCKVVANDPNGLGLGRQYDIETLEKAISLKKPALESMSLKGKNLIDGQGLFRVTEAMINLAKP